MPTERPEQAVSINCGNKHVERDSIAIEWYAVDVNGEVVVINNPGEGSITAYTLDGTTRNPRVIAAADAILYDGFVGTPHYDHSLYAVEIAHPRSGIESRIPADSWFDEPVPLLERTDIVDLEGET